MKRSWTIFLLAQFLILFAVTGPATAIDFHVTTASEFQGALAAAGSNGGDDTIYLAAGTYAGNFRFYAAEANKLTITAEPGAAAGSVILDGGKAGYVIKLEGNGYAIDFVFQKLIIQNGSSQEHGGGIYLKQTGYVGYITINGCVIKNNKALGDGGGAYLMGVSSVLVENSQIRDNYTGSETGYHHGGGIRCGDNSNFTNNAISNNSSSSAANGTGAYGGGVYSGSGSTFTNNTINGNSATASTSAHSYGGGVYSGSGSTFTNNTISGNSSSAYDSNGGGIYSGSNSSFANNTISGNSSSGWSILQGGGVYSGSGSTFTSNTISGNSSSSYFFISNGGGIYSGSNSSFANNTISGNSSSSGGSGSNCNSNGGGVYSGSNSSFANNTISGNSSSSSISSIGGGVYSEADTIFADNRIENNSVTVGKGNGAGVAGGGGTMVFTSNCISANQGGEGIALSYAALTFVNNTVAFNGGKGLRLTPNSAATTNIFNNIIWGNQATGDGSDITMNGYGAQSNFFNNLYASAFAIWDNQSGNLVADPLFLDAANGNFHVAVGSPAINAGLNTAPSMPEKDQEGNARILDGTVDIGAYERSTMAMHPADLNSNWIIEESELSAYVTAWKNNTAWVNGPNPIPMNYVSRAGYLSQKGGTYRNNGGERPTCWVMP